MIPVLTLFIFQPAIVSGTNASTALILQEQDRNHSICHHFGNTSCAQCIANPVCFWCESTGRCLPASRPLIGSRDLFPGCPLADARYQFCWLSALHTVVICLILFLALVVCGVCLVYFLCFRLFLSSRNCEKFCSTRRDDAAPYNYKRSPHLKLNTDQYKITPESSMIYGEIIREEIRQKESPPSSPYGG